MNTKTPNIASFVLRFTQDLWEDQQNEPQIRWRGHVRHVQGDGEQRFTDAMDAITFIQHHLTQLTAQTLSGSGFMSQEKILTENFKLWQTFASNYSDMMFQGMEQALKQSEAFQEQVQEVQQRAFKAWQLPIPSPSHTDLLKTVTALQNQVQQLTERVEELERHSSSQTKGQTEGKP